MAGGMNSAAAAKLRAIKKQLDLLDPAAPADLADFSTSLFGMAGREDLDRLSSAELAGLAKSAFDFIKKRSSGTPKIRISDPVLDSLSERPVTVVEIANDNMPFLLDSIIDLLQERGYTVRLVAHPIIDVKRDKPGKLKAFGAGKNSTRESVIHVHVDRLDAKEEQAELEAEIKSVLAEVRVAVDDWHSMQDRLSRAVADFKASPPPIPVAEIAEAIQFLEWLLDNNFTLLGMREYSYDDLENTTELNFIDRTGLGLLRDPDVKVLRRGTELVSITPEIREFLQQSSPLIVTKANVRSRVHRRAHMDYVGIKTFDENGQMATELRVLGLFTSTAYTKSVETIPYIRRKVDHVVRTAGVDPESHSGKALLNVLENYPRDEMFQIGEDRLSDFAIAVAQLEERPRIRVLVRPDKFDRFVSVLVFVPRDRFNTDVRIAIANYLAEVFDGRLSAFYPAYPEGPLARVHFIVGRYAGETPVVPQAELEEAVADLVRTWEDGLRDALTASTEPSRARVVFNAYNRAFTAAYKEAFSPQTAVADIATIERLSAERPLSIAFGEGSGEDDELINLRIYHFGRPIPLSDRMPIIENMGFRAVNERTYRIKRRVDDTKKKIWLHDIALTKASGGAVDLDALGTRLQAAFMAVWNGQAEDDGYAALTLNAGIPWRDVAILRALSRYLRQVRLPFSQDYMWQTLNAHSGIAKSLIDYFHTRFNPDPTLQSEMRQAREVSLLNDIETALQDVPSLDEDQIIRRFVNLMRALVRTNLFQLGDDGLPKPIFVFKFDPKQVDGLPEPRPYREIFVYSPRVEGVHLRGGPIARGGLRWSDRPQDFRTEVLGLAKAQQVKNAVIVPVGAKGGFVPKHLPVGGSRDAVFHEGREAYKLFISSLLDVTDNLDGDTVIPPRNVTRLEGDDPYLVVAADKGTATFSDTANAISQDHGFWLDDAFASGGSAGYDHKKMGITARGGWEAVKRHFREMDIDIQSEPFTVIGCGDMSGDVFGNGMLLSEKIRLQAAFNHQDIFIDPDPDPASSFKERKRLFNLDRSSWQDYNKKLISKGGGILSRSEKSLDLTPEMQALTGLSKARVSPFELINAILKMNADLLWFGGIGTYIRASGETDDMVGDRANDPVRITADELNAKVVGEGANLGMTHKARIAFALKGGRINTDAIDNSAGVNSSDLEVNIKIALGSAVRDGRLKTPARNKLLAAMTEEVAGLVLRNNYLQTLALSLVERRALKEVEFHSRFMTDLESRGLLDREVEDLPDGEALQARRDGGKGLTRPELAVLMAYAKITLFDALMASHVPDDPYLALELNRYFPSQMKRKFADTIDGHRLRREIIATMLANSMINRGGPVFLDRIADQTGASIAEIAAAFATVRDSYQMTAINNAIDALDTEIGGDCQLGLYRRVQDTLWRQTLWFARNPAASGGLEDQITRFGKGIRQLAGRLEAALPQTMNDVRLADKTAMVGDGVPEDLAQTLANLPFLSAGPDIIRVSETSGATIAAAAKVYFAVGDRFGMDRLARAAGALDLSDYYDRVAVNAALYGVLEAQRQIATGVLAKGRGKDPLGAWLTDAGPKVETTRQTVSDLAEDPALSIAKLSVAASMLRDLEPG